MAQKICSVKRNGTIRRNIHVKVQSTHARTIEILNLLGEDVQAYQQAAKLRLLNKMSANPNLNLSI
jgi:hypothetical protein